MEEAVTLLLIALGILFLVGIVCGVTGFLFAKREKHPIITIILSVLCWCGIVIPIKYTLGFLMSVLFAVGIGIYCIIIILKAIQTLKR